MIDILLTPDGDVSITPDGDIKLTNGVCQAVRIRLQWFFNEWRFLPQYGVPYFEDILIKKPNTEQIRRIIRDEVISVDEVLDARNIIINIDKPARSAKITLDIVTAGETFRQEVQIYA